MSSTIPSTTVAVSVSNFQHYKCKNLFNVDSSTFLASSEINAWGKVVSFKHTDREINDFDDVLTIRANYLMTKIGGCIANKKTCLEMAIQDNLTSQYETLREHTHSNNIDYLYLSFVSEEEYNIASKKIECLLYSNLGHSISHDPSCEIRDEPVLHMSGLAIIEAYYCQPEM